jgi:hypothetical protein
LRFLLSAHANATDVPEAELIDDRSPLNPALARTIGRIAVAIRNVVAISGVVRLIVTVAVTIAAIPGTER